MTSSLVDRLAGVAEGQAVKTAVRCATTANITLSGLQAIDGVTVVASDRVLVKSQTDTTQNGIYNASTGNWTRALDFDGARDAVSGTLVWVRSGGSINGESLWELTTADPIVFGTSHINFARSNWSPVLSITDPLFGGSWVKFNTWYRGRSPRRVTRYVVPPGDYTADSYLAQGGPGAVIEGYGATITLSAAFQTSVIPSTQAQPRFQSVEAGSQTITLVTASDASKFTVGKWVILMCFDLQQQGFPQNNNFFEYRLVIAIDSVGGVITFERPLYNRYKSTYPLNLAGTNTFPDEGGPATIMPMADDWDADMVVRGFTVTNNTPFYGASRTQLWEDVTFTGEPFSPTIAKRWTARRCRSLGNNSIEVDKLIELLEFDECEINELLIQSTSVERAIIESSSIYEHFGTAKYHSIYGGEINTLRLGVFAYGASRSLEIDSARINAFEFNHRGFAIADFAADNNGILKIAASVANSGGHDELLDMVPGGCYYLSDSGLISNYGSPFFVTDVWRDATYYYFQTTLDGPLPSIVGATHIAPHPCPHFTGINLTGCPQAVALSRAPKGQPLFSYYHSGTLTGWFGRHAGDDLAYDVNGYLKSFRVNVIRPYTGALGTLSMHARRSGGNVSVQPDGSNYAFDPVINLNIKGERIFKPGFASGIQSGDSGFDVGKIWMYGGVGPSIATDISAEDPSTWPLVEVEVIADQGLTSIRPDYQP